MSQPPVNTDAPTVDKEESSPDTSQPAASLTGRRVGPYVLERELGRGGMGSVWLGRRDDGRYEGNVAIKLLAASWLGRDGEVRFRREGTLLARLDHPNIARLLGAGVTDLGEPYLVLEYVEGRRIDEYCNVRGLDTRDRVKLFLELLEAIGHAHRNLIVHRDIKPPNVLVTTSGLVKLLDFGISKLVHENDALQTRSGHIMLTPQYAAPEQLLGGQVTTATDVYALGLLLYLLLSGRLPYADVLASPAELIRRITLGSMPLPSSVAVSREHAPAEATPAVSRADRVLRRELRGDLDNIVFKALHTTPEHRYQDVGAFGADLQRFLNHEPVTARAGSWLYRIGKFVRRNPAGVAAAALVMLTVWVATGITVSQMVRAEQREKEADLLGRTTEMLSDFINLSLFGSGGPDRPTLTREQQIEATADTVEKAYANNLGFAGQMLTQLAMSISGSAETQLPMRLLRRAIELGDKSKDVETMFVARCTLAQRLIMTGAVSEAATFISEALRHAKDLSTRGDQKFQCVPAQARLAEARSDSEGAAALLRDALLRVEAEGSLSRPIYTDLLSQLVVLYTRQIKIAAAMQANERQIAILEEFRRTDDSDYQVALQNRAQMLLYVGEVGTSLASREQLNRLTGRFFHPQEVPFPLIYNHAGVLLRMGRAEEGLAVIEKHIERARRAENPPELVYMLYYQARAHLQLRHWPEAARALGELQPLVQQGAADANMSSVIESLGAELALARGDVGDARQRIAAALQLAGHGTTKPGRPPLRTLLLAAEIALAADAGADAGKFATEALAFSESLARRPNSSADVGESLLLLEKARAAGDAPAQRRLRLQRVLECLRNGLHADHPRVREAAALLEQLRA